MLRRLQLSMNDGAKLSVAKAHSILGHSNEESTRATAKYLNWQLTRGSKKCESCAEAKAKQKNLPQMSSIEKAREPNGRLYHDLATVKAPRDTGLTVKKPN